VFVVGVALWSGIVGVARAQTGSTNGGGFFSGFGVDLCYNTGANNNSVFVTGGGQPQLTLKPHNYTQGSQAIGALVLLYQNFGANPFNGTNVWFSLSDDGPKNFWRLKNGAAFLAFGGSSVTNAGLPRHNGLAHGPAGGGASSVWTMKPAPGPSVMLVFLGVASLGWRRLFAPRGPPCGRWWAQGRAKARARIVSVVPSSDLA